MLTNLKDEYLNIYGLIWYQNLETNIFIIFKLNTNHL